ncbi:MULTISPECIES: tail fiber domain-containing protein [unclassified Wenzhouxiangella]|uniref:tail fiber domain-containing protein n=1 Tax=unclassified Wenzhouxiangella TaxID=2613841 RepID=UPI0015F29DAE|nr:MULTISPECIES: tail fiber domain-containing protein [unclassified Wenzhouxiangella]
MLRSTYQASIGLFLLFISIPITFAQTTLTYQGQLQEGGNLVDGETVGLFFELYDDPDPATGTLISSDGPFSVAVEDGLFQAELDFGEVDYTVAKYLRIQVNGTWLAETQEITSVPAAQYALGAGEVQWTNVLNAPAFWRLGGNAGTSPETDFIGTTDDTALELHVDGGRGVRIEPATDTIRDGFAPNLVAGAPNNTVTPAHYGATISGGRANVVVDAYGVIGGGHNNQAGNDDFSTPVGWYATVGGGHNNTASGENATIGGGVSNAASGASATLGGGSSNSVGGHYATIGGGSSNKASGNYATVGGGRSNTASGSLATVPGGSANEATADNSFAAGFNANANHRGAFVWADKSSSDVFASTADHQFLVRAAGGLGVGVNNPAGAVHLRPVGTGDMGLIIQNSGGGSGSADGGWAMTTGWDTDNLNFYWNDNLSGSWGPTARITTTGDYEKASDRTLKRDVEAIDGVLDRVLELRPVRYRFKKDTPDATPSIGFIAQEVRDIFPEIVSPLSDEVATLALSYDDFTPLAIQAIREQHVLIEHQSEQIDVLRSKVAELEKRASRSDQLEQRLAALEALLLDDERVARSE